MRITGYPAQLLAAKVRSVFAEKDYAFFDGDKALNLNLVGVRSPARESNRFDDHMLAIYRNEALEWVVDYYEITTDPGNRFLTRPINVDGAAILCPGQYRSTWKIGKHRGEYDALCQLGGSVKVWRDDNKDTVLDLDVSTQTGWFGINVHKRRSTADTVDSSSAGCQVFEHTSEYNEFMDTVKASRSVFGNSFTYTLLDEGDFQ